MKCQSVYIFLLLVCHVVQNLIGWVQIRSVVRWADHRGPGPRHIRPIHLHHGPHRYQQYNYLCVVIYIHLSSYLIYWYIYLSLIYWYLSIYLYFTDIYQSISNLLISIYLSLFYWYLSIYLYFTDIYQSISNLLISLSISNLLISFYISLIYWYLSIYH